MLQRKLIFLLAVALLVFGFASSSQANVTVEDIMAMVDENVHYTQAYVESEMIIRSGRREMVKEMKSYVKDENAFVEFTNRADRGTKYLKLDDELWMFFPDAEDLVKISGHMLTQGFMGSDMSYEDMLQSDSFTELYNFALLGEEDVDGRPTWVLQAEAKDGVEVSYANRKMWIDKELYIAIKEEMYALGGRLLKVTRITEFQEVEGRNYPRVVVMEDALRKNTETVLTIGEIDFNSEIPDSLFNLQNLMR